MFELAFYDSCSSFHLNHLQKIMSQLYFENFGKRFLKSKAIDCNFMSIDIHAPLAHITDLTPKDHI